MLHFKDSFPVVLSQDLVWGDMDAFQHINNTVYFRYFEDARIAYFEKARLMAVMEESGIGPILASTSCNFQAPLTFPDRIQVGTTVEEIRSKTFRMRYAVYSESLEKIAAEGEGLVVFYDYRQKRTCEIPDTVLSAFRGIQEGF